MTLRLITIPVSHYCEKARWALQRSGLEFVEEPHPPLLHLLPSVLRGGKDSVPVLVTPDATLPDSTDILRWVCARANLGLYPADPARRADVERLEERFDEELGPHVRRWAYWFILPERALGRRLLTTGAGALERAVFRVLQPGIFAVMRASMRIDHAGAARSRAKIDEVLAEVDALLADGRPFLTGDRFTAADLTFAALLAPLVCPPGYGPRGAPAVTPDELPGELGQSVHALRATRPGAFVLRLYAEERGRVSRPAAAGAPAAA